MAWGYSIGNVMTRAPKAPVAVSPALADTIMPLSNLGSGYPDQLAALQWRSDGVYAIDIDSDLLAHTSEREDAPNGCADLLLYLAGTPGLSANPCALGTYERAETYKCYRPEFWDVDVMPGEDVRFDVGIRLPAASTATGVRVRVVDLSTGDAWEGGSTDDWALDGVVESHAADSWLDVSATITAATTRTERAKYRVILEPIAAAYGATTFAYFSDPVLLPAVNVCAIVGHNLDIGATCAPAAGDTISVTALQPACYGTSTSEQFSRLWRLTLTQAADFSPRPILGEVWLGLYRTLLLGSPTVPFGPTERSHNLTLEGARGRRQVVPDEARHTTELTLPFMARSAAHAEQIRDEIARLTRHGAEPMLLFPGVSYDGAGRVLHGRIGEEVAYSIVSPTGVADYACSFGLTFSESPFAP